MKSALHFKNYKLFLGGSFFSLLGDYIGFAALNWVVWESTSSEIYLGLINFIRLLPALFIGFLGGSLADKYSRKKILILIYLAMAFFNFLLFYFMSSNNLNLFIIAVIVGIRALFVEIEPSVRNATLPDLVSKEALCSAVSFYSLTLNITATLGPALGGYFLVKVGAASLFLAQSFGQILVLCSLFLLPNLINVNKNYETAIPGKAKNYRDVFSFLNQRKDLVCAFGISCSLMFFLFPYVGMMPIFVDHVLKRGPETFGHFLMAASLGTVFGSSLVSLFKNKINLFSIAFFAMLSCFFFVILGMLHHVLYVYVILFFIGLFSQMSRTANRIYFQIHSPSEIRGKLLSVSLSDRGFIPLGALVAGFFSNIWGVANTFIFFGLSSFLLLILLLANFYFKKRKEVFQ